jgi:hypothetical protein
LAVFLVACSGGGAEDVAGKFWKALGDRDLEKARSYATRATAESLTMNNNNGDGEMDVEFGETRVEGGRTIIDTRMVAEMGEAKQTIELKTILVQEDGEWRVDVASTMMSMFGGAMGEMMQGMTDAMTDAMGEMVEGMGKAMAEGMERGFAQFGHQGTHAQKTSVPAEPDRTYNITFGYLRKRSDGTYYVYKETRQIPMHTGKFRWGYTIDAKGDPFTTYAIGYSPDGPMGDDGYPRTNAQGEQGWESRTTTVTDGHHSRIYRNDPGDTASKRKIEVYIEDRLAETIEFTVGKP